MAHMNLYSEKSATFGDRLVAARNNSRMSSKDVASRLGVKRSTLERWEADQSEPRPNKLQLLAGVLNVSMLWLMTGEGDDFDDNYSDNVSPDAEILNELRTLIAENLIIGRRLSKLERKLTADLGARNKATALGDD